MVPCIENGTIQLWIADRAYEEQRRLESGERVLVGVNAYRRDEPPPSVELYEVDPEELAAQIERVRRVRSERDAERAERALGQLRTAAAGTDNLMPHLVECSRAYCTLGEMVSVLRGVFGVFREPAVI
jgi:methylmalonyl-CoA mutase N-terminal domain/subunit